METPAGIKPGPRLVRTSDDDIEQLKRDAATLRMLGGFVLLGVSLILIRVVKGWDLEPKDEGKVLPSEPWR